MPGLIPTASVFVLFAVLAGVVNMTVLASLNKHVLLAVTAGIVLGGGVIVGSVTIGVPLMAVSVEGLQALIIAAAFGALIGNIGTISTVQPTTR